MSNPKSHFSNVLRRRAGAGLSFLLEAMACVFFAFPFYWMFITSFKTNTESITFSPSLWPRDFTLNAFRSIFQKLDLFQYLSNSLIIIISIVILPVLVMVPAAYVFARLDFREREGMFALVMVVFMIPVQITFISIYIMFAGTTVLGKPILQTLLSQIIPFGANAFGIFLLRQNFKQVPDEAARLDGAGELRAITHVILSLSKTTIVTIALFSFISHWNAYFWPLVMTSAERIKPITLALEKLKGVEYGISWPVLMAGNSILVFSVRVIFLFASKKIIQAMAFPWRGAAW